MTRFNPTSQQDAMGMAAANQQKWLITGVSTGFGRILATELATRGAAVVGTIRNPAQAAALNAAGVQTIVLDVTDTPAVPAAVASAIARLGGLDVLVNNAGYGQFGAVEALSEAEFRAVMDTNFIGAVSVTRAALPVLRPQRNGVIVNISSMAGIVGFGGAAAYNASKFALEGFSDALSLEMQPFGVKVMIVEPGAFRTDFSGRSIRVAAAKVDAYAGTQVGDIHDRLAQYHGHEPGDPLKLVDAMIKIIESGNIPLRLPMGADAVQAIEVKLQKLSQGMLDWEPLSLSTAFA